MQNKTYINSGFSGIKTPSGNVTTIKFAWANEYERHIYLFVRLAIDVLPSTKNQTKAVELMRCCFNVINKIMHNSVGRCLNRQSAANVADTLKNHLRGIINATANTFPNAITERLNGKIQEVKPCGRGYRSLENFYMQYSIIAAAYIFVH